MIVQGFAHREVIVASKRVTSRERSKHHTIHDRDPAFWVDFPSQSSDDLRPRIKTRCVECGEIGEITGRTNLPNVAMHKMFANKGWRKAKRGMECPSCVNHLDRAVRMEKQLTEIVSTVQVGSMIDGAASALNAAQQVHEVPGKKPEKIGTVKIGDVPVPEVKIIDQVKEDRAMSEAVKGPATIIRGRPTPEQERRIYSTLEEAWDADKSDFKPGWSDEKIAVLLGVTLTNVEYRRKKAFGHMPAKKLQPLSVLQSRITGLEDLLLQIMDRIDALEKKR